MDPALGRVPYERLTEARQQLTLRTTNSGNQAPVPGVTWQERGPSNSGGRTRALLFDPNDPNRRKVWAGSLSGGLWYTTDITDANAIWTPVGDAWENSVVTALAADPTNPQVMYAGTGDYYSGLYGGGIWKTSNAGTTWTRLSNTIPGGSYPSVNQSLGYVQRIIVNSSGQVFAATRFGVLRSTDGGSNWMFVLAPNQGIGAGTNTGSYYSDLVTDLELASDGALYAAMNPSRVFKSTNGGTIWTEITPLGVTGERTELALAPTTNGSSQVVYAVSRSYNSTSYGQDIKWFKKSTNGGTSWVDVMIPTFGWGDHFTAGNGQYRLNLSVHPTDANTIYAGGYDWFRSTDGGSTWAGPLANRYTNQQGLWFQPGNTGAAFADENGVRWSADWGNSAVASPTFISRNNGYRASEITSVSMTDAPGNSFLLAGLGGLGYAQLTSAGLSAGSVFWSVYSPGLTFIDQNEPTLQIFQSYQTFYAYNRTSGSITQLTTTNAYSIPNPSDYDNQANTLYTADYGNGQAIIRKVTGVGTTPAMTQFPIPGATNWISCMKLGLYRDALFVGTYNGQLFKIVNLNQSTPVATAIDNGALPQYTTISSIDMGVNDDELLVTLSNYGVQSVWYTRDGGGTWLGKDQTNFGLPDVPIRTALFNPQNRQQVLLGTDVGVWSTNDITATNPGWTYTSAGIGAFRINQLRYRPSDGRITAATNGRGIWTTDAFAVPYTIPTVTLTGISNTTLCAGNVFSVSFRTGGPAFGAGNQFEAWISDASGNFANQRKIGSGTSSPISVTLPSGYSALPYGTGYRLKVVATSPEVESGPSDALAVGDLMGGYVTDRSAYLNSYSTSGTICPDSRTTLRTVARNGSYNSTIPETYQWQWNDGPITGATSLTLSAQQAGNYQVSIRQAGCSVLSDAYQLSVGTPLVYVRSLANDVPQCTDRPASLTATYIGETGAYQWTRDGVDITGATSSTFSTNQTGAYAFRLSNGNCAASSSAQKLLFGQSLYAQALVSPAYDSLLYSGGGPSVYLNADRFYDEQYQGRLYSIQWYRDNVALTGSNATLNYYYANQPGAYSFVLTQGSCQTRSNAVVVSMANQMNASIDYYYKGRAACPGESRFLYAKPSANAGFQWQRNGVDIPGATNYNYEAQQSGNYTVKITRGNYSATSAPVSLTFANAIQPKVFFYGNSAEVCSGLSLYANDSYNQSGYSYQWLRDGTAVGNGSSYFAYQSGLYSVRVTNGSCTGLSKEVFVKTGQRSKPTIITNRPVSQICAGNSFLLTVNSSEGGYFQWQRNGAAIPGATSYQFFATQPGLYSVILQDAHGGCSAESNPVDLNIGELTTAAVSGNALISYGQTATLPITFTGPAPWSFTLSNGQSVLNTYQNPYLLPVAPINTTTYVLTSVANACGTGTVSGSSSVTVGTGSADVSVALRVSNRTPAVGDVVTVSCIIRNDGPSDPLSLWVTCPLPDGLTYVDSPNTPVYYRNGAVLINAFSMPPNLELTNSFRVRVTKAGQYRISGQVSASQTPDPDSQPDSGTRDGQDDTATLDLRTSDPTGSLLTAPSPYQTPLPQVAPGQLPTDPGTADLSLTMSADTRLPKAGDVVSLSLTVGNRGGSSASGVVLQTLLPPGWSVVNAGGLVVSDQTVKVYVNGVSSGQWATRVLAVRVGSGSGLVQAQILSVEEDDPDSRPGNGYRNGEDDEASINLRTR